MMKDLLVGCSSTCEWTHSLARARDHGNGRLGSQVAVLDQVFKKLLQVAAAGVRSIAGSGPPGDGQASDSDDDEDHEVERALQPCEKPHPPSLRGV
jgi:hypothetical protein